jgi:hypothetical protein
MHAKFNLYTLFTRAYIVVVGLQLLLLSHPLLFWPASFCGCVAVIVCSRVKCNLDVSGM